MLLAGAGYAAEWWVLSSTVEPRTTLAAAFACQVAWNVLAAGAYLARARRGGEEARGFRVGVLAFAALILANLAGLLGLRGSGAAGATAIAFLVAGGVAQGAGVLLWPWRRASTNRPVSALGAAVFTASVVVLFWGIGSWTADRGREPFFSSVQLGLTLRQVILSCITVYLLLESPRRCRGMLGWIAVGAVGGGLVLTSLQAFLGGGRLVSAAVSSAVGLVPLLMGAGAWAGAPVEVEAASAPADRRWLVLVFLPFVVSGVTLAAAHLDRPGPLALPTLGFVLIAAGVVAVAGLLVRELEAGQRQLEARVDDRTRELEQAMVQLVRNQRLSVVATLAAGAVHDLKNLLGVIRNHAAVLREELAGAPPGTRESATDLGEAADRAAALVRHLLGYLRDETEPAVVVDLAAAVGEEEGVLRAVVPRTIALALELPAGPAFTRASPRRVEQILLNLLANSAGALGGRGRIAVRLQRAEGGWALQVEDDGPGLPAEIVAHLFEPLRTTRAEAGGLGLGLASVKALAAQDGATVAVRTAPETGTAVTVVYPALAAGAAVTAGAARG